MWRGGRGLGATSLRGLVCKYVGREIRRLREKRWVEGWCMKGVWWVGYEVLPMVAGKSPIEVSVRFVQDWEGDLSATFGIGTVYSDLLFA
jgi:hypothetical protein